MKKSVRTYLQAADARRERIAKMVRKASGGFASRVGGAQFVKANSKPRELARYS